MNQNQDYSRNSPEPQERPDGQFTGRIRMLSVQAGEIGQRLARMLENLRGAPPPAPVGGIPGPNRQSCIEDYLGQHEATNTAVEDRLAELERLIG